MRRRLFSLPPLLANGAQKKSQDPRGLWCVSARRDGSDAELACGLRLGDFGHGRDGTPKDTGGQRKSPAGEAGGQEIVGDGVWTRG
jgi:hypothetical protein